jgi:hypothetical protein
MKLRWMGIAAGLVALAAATAGAGSARVHADGYPRGAPPGVTGGFGEPTCLQCHFGGALNEPGGSLSIDGLPERYAPGETYRLIVRLRGGEVGAAGFQLSARTAAGAQAGVLASGGMKTHVQAGAGGVQYAGHTEAGSSPTAPGAAEWAVEWTAPARGAGPIQLHASANAGDGDNSPIGDHVYAVEKAVPPR